MSAGKVVLGVMAGVAMGTALGMLVAPDKGSKTRKKLVKKGNDLAGKTEDRVNEFADKMTKKLQSNDSK